MEVFWLQGENAIEFNAPRHLPNARLALYWEIGDGLMVLFPAIGELHRSQEAANALPRHLSRRRLYAGVADLTNQSSIDWRSRRHDFVTSLEIQQKMRAALFGI